MILQELTKNLFTNSLILYYNKYSPQCMEYLYSHTISDY